MGSTSQVIFNPTVMEQTEKEPHNVPLLRADGWTDKGKSKCPPPLQWEHEKIKKKKTKKVDLEQTAFNYII